MILIEQICSCARCNEWPCAEVSVFSVHHHGRMMIEASADADG